MPNYDFKSLSHSDFEDLTRDLLQKERNITLECFKSGRDQGIDLRYQGIDLRFSRALEENLIVQCKHYAVSGYQKLYKHLQNEELEKVKKLNPSHYILATSVCLTPDNKDKIKDIFTPCCPTNVYGGDDLNNLIGKFPEIETQHFKLWLTSQAVMDRILHSTIFTQTEISDIKKNLKLYVQNKSFFQAKKIINEHNYCLITGMPGIGKTTLAEVLLIDYLDQGYNATKIVSDISEALSVYNPQKKQVFYYDDFLGQTKLEYKFNKNEEQNIINFIKAVQKSHNTKLIMTTREYILNQAKHTYEKLYNSDIDIYKCVIDISSYTVSEREKIFSNHIDFSNCNQEYKNAILNHENYLKIIEHSNFNPRIIESMTTHPIKISGENFISKLIENLDNPLEIWNHPFEHQISNTSRDLLMVLVSLPSEVFRTDLETAFNSFCRKNQLSVRSADFNKAVKEIEGDFIKIDESESNVFIQLSNPSIRDFLETYLSKNDSEVINIFESATFFEQVVSRCGVDNVLSSGNKTKKIDVFLKAVQRTFYADSCQTKYDFSFFEELNISEERLWVLSDIVKTFNSEGSLSLMNFLVERLIECVKASKVHKHFLIELLIDLKTKNLDNTDLQEELIITAKLFLKNQIVSVRDYIYLLIFAKFFSDKISSQEIENIKTQFLAFYKDDMNFVISKGSAINLISLASYISYLKIVAESFNINIQEELIKLWDHYGRLLTDMIRDEMDYYDYEDDYEMDYDDEYVEESQVDPLLKLLRD